MKAKQILAIVAVPVIAAGYIVYHPGVAYAETVLAKTLKATPFQQGGSYTVDGMHTCLGFDIGHLGLSRVQGRFSKMTGSLQIDAKDLTKSSVKVTADATSIDTAVAPRDADLRSANFFDVEKFPTVTFESTQIKKSGNGYNAAGNLTIHGVSKPITIHFKQYGPIKDPWGNTRIGVVAEPLVIHRSDFGMTFDAETVSNDVNVHLSLEATQDKAPK